MPLEPAVWLNDFTLNLSTTGAQSNPRITQLANGNILVVWMSDNNTGVGDPTGTDLIGQLFDPLGASVGVEFRVNQQFNIDNERSVDIAALDDGGYLVVYEDDEGANGVQLRLEQHNADETFPNFVTIQTDSATTEPNWRDPHAVVSSATSALVVYVAVGDITSGSMGGDSDIMGRIYDPSTNTFGAEIALITGGEESDSDVAVLENGDYVVVASVLGVVDRSIELRIISASGANVLIATSVPGTVGPHFFTQ